MAPRVQEPLVIPPTKPHTATVIFSHGLGDTGHGWLAPVVNWRRREKLADVKFVLPHAPIIPITANFGMQMPGWFDIKALDGSTESLRQNEDVAGVKRSQEYFHGLIQKEIDAGIPADRIVLAGFSQGGAMSIFAGLTSKVKLAGIVGLSSWLLLSGRFKDEVPEGDVNKATPVLMCHGAEDPLVRTAIGKQSYQALKDMGYNVEWKEYEGMGHSACEEELEYVEEFLAKQLASPA